MHSHSLPYSSLEDPWGLGVILPTFYRKVREASGLLAHVANERWSQSSTPGLLTQSSATPSLCLADGPTCCVFLPHLPIQSLASRLKENMEKLTEERDQRIAAENREKEQNKRLQRQLRDTKEEMGELARKEAEASRKKHELVMPPVPHGAHMAAP